MANTITFSLAANSTHTTTTITDSTSYNNPSRGAVGVFLGGFKVDFRGTEESFVLTPNDEDPLIVTSWTFELDLDGHYRFKYIAPPIFNSADTYDIYDAVYDTTTDAVYRSKQNGNTLQLITNTTWWELITSPVTLADNKGKYNESTNTDTLAYNRVIYTLTSDKRDTFAIDGSVEQDTDAERNKNVDKFRLLDIFTEGLRESDSSGEYNKGERIARRAAAV